MSSAARTTVIALVSAGVAGLAGYALAPVERRSTPEAAFDGSVIVEDDSLAPEEGLGRDDGLRECEARLASVEELLARTPAVDRAVIDPASVTDETRAAIAAPEVSRAIDAEVERRIAERFERERARRETAWAERRTEARERLHAIGIDDATIEAVTPTMCAIRDVYRQAWQSGRGGAGGGGDAGGRMGRRELRAATRNLREEVETTLGAERTASLEAEGGLRALGGAVECGGEAGPPGSGPPPR